MNVRRAKDVPSLVAVAAALTALLVIVGSTWFAGGQHSVITQWQFVLLAFGLGVGLVALAGALHLAGRHRDGERRVEEALARMLQAAAAVPQRQVIQPQPGNENGSRRRTR